MFNIILRFIKYDTTSQKQLFVYLFYFATGGLYSIFVEPLFSGIILVTYVEFNQN